MKYFANKKNMVAFGALLIYIALFVGLSVYTYPTSDDYSWSVLLAKDGFWKPQIDMWHNHMGRFTILFIGQLGQLLGIVNNYGWHVPLWVGLSIFSLFILVSSIWREMQLSARLFGAFLLQAVWLSAAVGLNENLYWFSGSFYYYTSIFIILELAAVANICNDYKPRASLLICALLVFLNSAVIEISAVYQIAMFASAAVVCWFSNKKRAMQFMLLLMFVAILGVVVQLLAPGNHERLRFTTTVGGADNKSVFTTLKVAIWGGLSTAREFFSKPIIYAFWLFLPFIDRHVKIPRFVSNFPIKIRLWQIIAVQSLTAIGLQSMSGYLLGTAFPPRAEGLIIWLMAAQWIFFFVFCYRNEKVVERIKSLWLFRYRSLALGLCLVLNGNFFAVANDYLIESEFSRQLNARHLYIEEQKKLGNLELIVPRLTVEPKLLFFADMEGIDRVENPALDWRNAPYAEYFGLKSMRTALPQVLEIARTGDVTKEFESIIELANNGDVEALRELIALYSSKSSPFFNGGKPIDISWLIKSAEQGAREAKRLVAGYFRRGWGTPDGKPDYIQSAKWYWAWLWNM